MEMALSPERMAAIRAEYAALSEEMEYLASDDKGYTASEALGLLSELLDGIDQLRAACEASWALGHKVYHNANHHQAEQIDWPHVRRLLADALGVEVSA